MPRAVALFSGGLDSTLAIRILQRQGFEVDALSVRTTFACGKAPPARAAAELGIRQTVLDVGEDYLDLIRSPRHGYGRAVNPCVDCRIHMAKMARQLMENLGACVVISGEVLGQRPMSQKRCDLEVIAHESGLDGRLLRPLSAKQLAPTIPEREGLVDRDRLYGFSGRGRTKLTALARQLGLRVLAQPSTGCALTEESFAPRVRDLMRFSPSATTWDFELLNIGRHIRLDESTKAVVGRNAEENAVLRSFAARADASESARIEPEGFTGPDVLLVGEPSEPSLRLAGALVLRWARRPGLAARTLVRVTHDCQSRVLPIEPGDGVEASFAPL